MAYIPVERSVVAANLDKIRRVRNLAFKSTGSTDGEVHLMSKIINFEREIQQVVDKPANVSGKYYLETFQFLTGDGVEGGGCLTIFSKEGNYTFFTTFLK